MKTHKSISIGILILLATFFACDNPKATINNGKKENNKPSSKATLTAYLTDHFLMKNFVFTDDMAVHVINGVVYIFPAHDSNTEYNPINNYDWQANYNYTCFTTTDFNTFVYRGDVTSASDYRGKGGFWDGDCGVAANGKYYTYPCTYGDNSLWVGVSDTPDGHYVNARADGSPLATKNLLPEAGPSGWLVSSCVFIEDDGTPYIYFGQPEFSENPKIWCAKLKPNMIEFAETPRLVSISKSIGYAEDNWVYKRNGIYYHHFRDQYETADNPYGPFTYKGHIFSNTGTGTDQIAVIQYKNKWYAFHHSGAGNYGNMADPRICKQPMYSSREPFGDQYRHIMVSELHFNSDGTIQEIDCATDPGVGVYPKILVISAYPGNSIKAAHFQEASSSGHANFLRYFDTPEGNYGNLFVEFTDGWIRFNNVDFENGAAQLMVRAKGTGNIEFRVDSPNGEIVGSVSNLTTDWQELTGTANAIIGKHDLYIMPNEGIVSLDWFRFNKENY